MKTKLLLLLLLFVGVNASAQFTSIPDTNFEAKLIALGIDDVADGKVLTSKINTLKELNASRSSITDLTGIQDFVALTSLNCDYNELTTLDISLNTALTSLTCVSNKLTLLDISKNTALTSLSCSYNKLSSIDVSKNTALIYLYCGQNQLTSLDVSKNTSLNSLVCSQNLLTSLDVNKNTSLKGLSCSDNKLTSLDVSKNTSLANLQCGQNKLTSLDVSNNTALTLFTCRQNAITSLDISKNTLLTYFQCGYNKLTILNIKNGNNTLFSVLEFAYNENLTCIAVDDVAYATIKFKNQAEVNAYFSPYDCTSITQIPNTLFEDKLIAIGIDKDGKNGSILNASIETLTSLDVSNSSLTDLKGIEGFKALTTLNCSNNLLDRIDLSKNTAMNTLNCSNNPMLTCIQVTDIALATNSWTTIKDATANFNLDCRYYTLIPDTNFETKLITLGYDDAADGKVLTSNINKVKSLYIRNSSISDLTGIQDFTSLISLTCDTNLLTSLDVSKNTALKGLECHNNKITRLDISNNPNLTTFYCSNNLLTSLNLKNGKNTLLNSIAFASNPFLYCITVDDAAYANTNWTDKKETHAIYSSYDCSSTTLIPNGLFEDKLIALGIDTDGKNGVVLNSSIATLTTLDVSNSSLTDLSGLQGFTALTTLNCSNNLLKSIDLSRNSAITTLNCSNNANLTCIQVADIALATNNWTTTKDAAAAFNLDCRTYTLIPDKNFEAKLISLGLDEVPDGKVETSKINTLKTLNVSNLSIIDLTGIQDFVALKELSCRSNKITSLDVTKNTALTTLNADYNQLSSLTLNTALLYLDCSNNKLQVLDINNSTALKSLNIRVNQLSNLDLSKNTALTNLNCTQNRLISLNISKNTALTSLSCASNELTSLNLKNGNNTNFTNLYFSWNEDLYCIIVDNVEYAKTNWSNQEGVDFSSFFPYDCSTITEIPNALFEDKLISLGIDTDGKNGAVLNSSIEKITTLDVSNSLLTDLKGLEGFTALTTLNCANNLLNSIDISKNTALTTLDCSTNENLNCIQVAAIDAAKKNIKTTPEEATANFNLDCNAYTLIPDPNFEKALIQSGLDDVADGRVQTSKISKLKTLYASFKNITDLTGIQDFKALTSLDCQHNNLKSLDLSKNTALTDLNCSWNQLTSLEINKNTVLTDLDCSVNQLPNLDVSLNTALKYFNCSSNKLTNLDINNNTELSSLKCYANQLTSLDISKNITLSSLDCYSNQLTELDLTKSPVLYSLNCNSNQLTNLDLSKNPSLRTLYCDSNKLTTLNLKNGKNSSLSTLSFFENPYLSCITVDDVAYANTNWSNKKNTNASYTTNDCSEVTIIPNLAFEDKLIALGIDTDGKNGFVVNSSIATLTTLDVSNSSIADLTGLEGFKALKTLNVSNNLLDRIDLSKNTTLTTLNCANNASLTCIQVADVSETKNWIVTKDAKANFNLDCKPYTLIPDTNFEAKLIELGVDDIADGKVLTSNINTLKSLSITSANIADLTGIQDFVALTSMSCSYNNLTSLDVSKNEALQRLYCDNNQITGLDVSKNIALEDLSCKKNKIASLDISKNVVLDQLICSENLITSLDVSKNTKLTYLYCQNNNKLTYLNLKNGNNINFFIYNFSDNPSLTCIAVDDVAYSNSKWLSAKDKDAFYSAYDCATITEIPNELFEDKLIALGIDTDGKNGFVFNSSIETLTTLDLSNSSLTDVTGIEGFKTITVLNVSNNLLSSLDLSKNSALTTLNSSANPSLTCIQVADVTVATNNWTTTKDENTNFGLDCRPFTLIPDANFEAKLIDLEIDDVADGRVLTSQINTLTSLNVTSSNITDLTGIQDFIALTSLRCYFNELTSLDISKNIALTHLDCSSNELTSLNLKNGNNTKLSSLSISGNSNLTCIVVDDVTYANDNWSNKKNTNAFYSNYDCSTVTQIPDAPFEDKLIALGIDTDGKNGLVLNSSIEALTTLDVSNSSITNLKGIEGFTALTNLNCSTNQLTALNVSESISLNKLNVASNKLITLDLTKNVALTNLDCNFNTLKTLDLSKNIALSDLACANNSITSLDVTKNPELKKIDCSTNQLINLSLDNNTKLVTLTAAKNKLATLNLTNNIALTSLDLTENKLKLLNISTNVTLTDLNCSSNQLITLNLKNGNNTNLNVTKIDFKNNPNLSCILVDDKTYSDTNWSNLKDATATYNNQCELNLSSDNFIVEIKAESCLGENNGEINITAVETFLYTASINGQNYPFTNNTLAVTNLAPGNYTVSITIPGETFEQNYILVIAKATSITGKSSVSSKKVNVEITDGTAPYTVFVNGVEQFETSDSNFSVSAKGNGLLEVKTAKACEGIYSEDILGLDMNISAYPNPTSGSFEIELPIANKEVTIEINSLEGRLISSKKYSLENGTAQLTLQNEPNGIYIAKIYLDTIKTIKIIKN